MAVQHRRQRLAFGGAGDDQRLQRLVERAHQRLVQRGKRLFALLILVFLLDHAAHAQQAVGGGAAAPVSLRTSSTKSAELGQQSAIDAQRLGLGLRW